MHRSGTSALSRSLNILGLRQPDDLLEPNEHNPLGYWEPRKIVQFNDRLLAEIKRHWADPKPMPLGWQDSVAGVAASLNAKRLLADEFAPLAGLIIKDPRISRLAPVWRKAISQSNGQHLALIACRNPLDVHSSLQRRDKMGREHALRLWQAYMLEAEFNSRGMPRAVIHYDELMEDWRATLQTAFSACGLVGIDDMEATGASLDQFISSSHRHHDTPSDSFFSDPDVDGDIKEIYQLFLQNDLDTNRQKFDRLRQHWQEKWAKENPGLGQSDYPQNIPTWHIEKSAESFANGDVEAAIVNVKRAIELDSDQAVFHHQLGIYLTRAGQFQEASDSIRRAIDLNGTAHQFYSSLAEALNRLNQTDAAIEAVRAALDLNATTPHYWHQLGRFLINADRLEEAEAALLRTMDLDVNNAHFHSTLATILQRRGKHEQALSAIEIAIKLDPDIAGFYHQRASFHAQTGRLEAAETDFRTAINLQGEIAHFHRGLSQVLGRQQRLDEAIDAVKNAIRIDPEIGGFHQLLGNLLVQSGFHFEAESAYRRAIENGPPSARLFAAHADVLNRAGKRDDAMGAIHSALRLDPNNGGFHTDLGYLLAKSGERDAAISAFDEALASDFTWFGDMSETMGDEQAVLAALNRVAKRPNEFQVAEWAVRLIVQLNARWWVRDTLRVMEAPATSNSNSPVWPIGSQPLNFEFATISPRNDPSRKPTVSVMIPVFNVEREDWLRECIDSVLAQNHDEDFMEIVVVDDASQNANAKQVADRYGPRVTYKRNGENLGLVGNHNACIEAANGDFVHILHQDDRVEIGFYEAVVGPMLNDDDLIAAFCSTKLIDEEGDHSGHWPIEFAKAGPHPRLLERLGQDICIMFPSIVVRRSAYEAVGGFSSSFKSAFDWEMWGRLAAAGTVWHVPNALANYRSHKGSASFRFSRVERIVEEIRAVESILAAHPPSEIIPATRIAFLRILRNCWRHLLLYSKFWPAAERRDLYAFLVLRWPDDKCRDEVKTRLAEVIDISPDDQRTN